MSASAKKKLRKEQNAAQLTEKQLREKKEAKKLKNYTVTFVIVMVLVVCLGIGMIGGTAFINSGILERNTDAVKIGDRVLTNAQLNYYYVDAINNTYNEWYQEYGDYMSLMALMSNKINLSMPLNEQAHPTDEGRTYADFFVDMAIAEARRAYALNDLAAAKGITLSEDDLTDIDDLISSQEMLAPLYGYNNLKGYLKGMYGNGATEESYREYLTVTKLASNFQNKYRDELAYTADDLKDYNDKHYDEFSSFSFTYFFMEAEDFLEHAEGDNAHNHTDADKAAALKKAEEAAKKLAESGAKTVEEFEAAIKKVEGWQDEKTLKATDNNFVMYSEINENIAKWLADKSRKAGDLAMIPYTTTSTDGDGKETTTTSGYFVVLFEEVDTNDAFLVDIRHILVEFKGGTKNDAGETVYSDTEKKTALDKITEIQNTWLEGDANEESFKQLAIKETDDSGSASAGGLYEDVYPHQMVENFDNWCFDAARKAGDYGIVETEYGYHLIYFVKTGDTTYRNQMIEDTLRKNDYTKWYEALPETISAEVLNTSRLDLDLVMAG